MSTISPRPFFALCASRDWVVRVTASLLLAASIGCAPLELGQINLVHDPIAIPTLPQDMLPQDMCPKTCR